MSHSSLEDNQLLVPRGKLIKIILVIILISSDHPNGGCSSEGRFPQIELFRPPPFLVKRNLPQSRSRETTGHFRIFRTKAAIPAISSGEKNAEVARLEPSGSDSCPKSISGLGI